MNLHPCSSLTERGKCVVRVARVYSSKHVLQVSNRLCRCIVHFSECLWFICCPNIFDYFGVKKLILKLDWSISYSLTILQESIILILVWRLSLIILETSGLTFSMNSLHPKSTASWPGSLGLDPKDLRHLQFEIALWNLSTHFLIHELQIVCSWHCRLKLWVEGLVGLP